MVILSHIKRLINSISTQPNRRNWMWNNSFSVLAFFLLYSVYILRALSLLQILKRIYRGIKEKKNKADRDTASKRVNVPPVFVEIYFISFTLILFAFYLYVQNIYTGNMYELHSVGVKYLNTFINCVCFYFLIESSIWVLYYFVLRRFFEEKYAIMHALEYILLIPLVIIGQGLSFAILKDISFFQGVNMILNPNDLTPTYISILNILYIAVVIGVVISTLPSERIKEKGKSKYDISIIGAGDVVANRLIPALEKADKNLNIAIYDIAKTSIDKNKRYYINGSKFTYKLIDKDFQKNALNSNIIWIATPSYTHLLYLEEFINKDVFIVVEKPLTSLKSEYSTIKKILKSNEGNKVFCLSYYYLEKALPLVYLFSPMIFYEKYLLFSQDKRRDEILAAVCLLGSIKEVRLYLLEQTDNRSWVKSDIYGGQYMDTFIHVALLNRMIFGEDSSWENINWTIGDYKKEYKSTYIECTGTVADTDFHLYMGKFMPKKKREGIILYENGQITIDFENSICRCTYYHNIELDFSISLNRSYPKYGVLADMVKRCCQKNITPSMVDGSDLQLKTLNWLFSNDLSKVKHFDYDETSDKVFFKVYQS